MPILRSKFAPSRIYKFLPTSRKFPIGLFQQEILFIVSLPPHPSTNIKHLSYEKFCRQIFYYPKLCQNYWNVGSNVCNYFDLLTNTLFYFRLSFSRNPNQSTICFMISLLVLWKQDKIFLESQLLNEI